MPDPYTFGRASPASPTRHPVVVAAIMVVAAVAIWAALRAEAAIAAARAAMSIAEAAAEPRELPAVAVSCGGCCPQATPWPRPAARQRRAASASAVLACERGSVTPGAAADVREVPEPPVVGLFGIAAGAAWSGRRRREVANV